MNNWCFFQRIFHFYSKRWTRMLTRKKCNIPVMKITFTWERKNNILFLFHHPTNLLLFIQTHSQCHNTCEHFYFFSRFIFFLWVFFLHRQYDYSLNFFFYIFNVSFLFFILRSRLRLWKIFGCLFVWFVVYMGGKVGTTKNWYKKFLLIQLSANSLLLMQMITSTHNSLKFYNMKRNV